MYVGFSKAMKKSGIRFHIGKKITKSNWWYMLFAALIVFAVVASIYIIGFGIWLLYSIGYGIYVIIKRAKAKKAQKKKPSEEGGEQI